MKIAAAVSLNYKIPPHFVYIKLSHKVFPLRFVRIMVFTVLFSRKIVATEA